MSRSARRPARVRAALVAALSGVLMLAGTPAAQADATSDTYERSVVNYTNSWRAVNDMVKLKESPCLDTYAEAWARHLGTSTKTLVHRTSTSLRSILKACNKSGIGENLAMGFSTGQSTFNAWRSSPGHNRNMLTSKFRWTAVGAYKVGDRWWVVQLLAN